MTGEHVIKFGLTAGSGDLIGWTPVIVTPEMVGKKIAIFTSVEIKEPGKYPKAHQKNWVQQVQQAGGIAGWASSVEQAEEIFSEQL